MEWVGTARAAYAPWLIVLGALVVLIGVPLSVLGAGEDARAGWLIALIPLLSGAFVLVSGVLFGRVRLLLDATGAHVLWGPWRWPRIDAPWSEVRSLEVVDVRAWPWGGWGMRWSPRRHGRAALVRQGEGVQFDLVGGRILVVTIDHAAEAVEVGQGRLAGQA